MPEMSRADWCIGVGIDLGAEPHEIGRPAERDEHFSGDNRMATEQFDVRAILSGLALGANPCEAERHQHRSRERDDDG